MSSIDDQIEDKISSLKKEMEYNLFQYRITNLRMIISMYESDDKLYEISRNEAFVNELKSIRLESLKDILSMNSESSGFWMMADDYGRHFNKTDSNNSYENEKAVLEEIKKFSDELNFLIKKETKRPSRSIFVEYSDLLMKYQFLFGHGENFTKELIKQKYWVEFFDRGDRL